MPEEIGIKIFIFLIHVWRYVDQNGRSGSSVFVVLHAFWPVGITNLIMYEDCWSRCPPSPPTHTHTYNTYIQTHICIIYRYIWGKSVHGISSYITIRGGKNCSSWSQCQNSVVCKNHVTLSTSLIKWSRLFYLWKTIHF